MQLNQVATEIQVKDDLVGNHYMVDCRKYKAIQQELFEQLEAFAKIKFTNRNTDAWKMVQTQINDFKKALELEPTQKYEYFEAKDDFRFIKKRA
jgi:hypothetical protein